MDRPLTSKSGAAPEWIFRWRHNREPWLPKMAALILCATAFTLFLTVVRVRVVPPMQPEGRKASLIYLSSTNKTSDWALRAQEGGPFPSRFEPTTWSGYQALNGEAMRTALLPPATYSPELRDLPENPDIPPPRFASPGHPVFPHFRKEHRAAAPKLPPLQLAPVIEPLSNLTRDELPDSLPPFVAPLDSTLTATAWHLLVRLRPDGSVAESVTLTGDSSTGSAVLAAWLQSVRFKPSPAKPSLWVGIGISFINTRHGPDTH